MFAHRQRKRTSSILRSMGANEHMLNAIRQSKHELSRASDTVTGELEKPERGQGAEQGADLAQSIHPESVSTEAL